MVFATTLTKDAFSRLFYTSYVLAKKISAMVYLVVMQKHLWGLKDLCVIFSTHRKKSARKQQVNLQVLFLFLVIIRSGKCSRQETTTKGNN